MMLSKYTNHLNDKKIGKYTCEERMEKIIKFKLKQYKHREKFPISRKFGGRTKVASSKNRSKGRFVKQASKKIKDL